MAKRVRAKGAIARTLPKGQGIKGTSGIGSVPEASPFTGKYSSIVEDFERLGFTLPELARLQIEQALNAIKTELVKIKGRLAIDPTTSLPYPLPSNIRVLMTTDLELLLEVDLPNYAARSDAIELILKQRGCFIPIENNGDMTLNITINEF